MILYPDPIIELLRSEQERDNAFLALLAAVTGEPPETAWETAANRCRDVARVLRDMNSPPPNMHGGKRGHGTARDVLAYLAEQEDRLARPKRVSEMALAAARLAERAQGPLRQVAAKQAAGGA